MTSLRDMLGNDFEGKNGAKLTWDADFAGKKIGLYFSAHWCPPCRGFTPTLAKTYEKLVNGKKENFDIIFVSSDRDEKAFNEYYGEMPWKALPFADRDRKAALSKHFKVNGIPSLIILDENLEVINKSAVGDVRSDAEGENFPWRPPTLKEALGVEDGEFEGKNGEKLTWKKDFAGKKVGLYFSGHWCPPCRNFTPKLVSTYNKLVNEKKENFDIIFVSSDRDEKSFKDYYGEMPWKALPFADKKRKQALSDYFEIEGIPSLVILDENMQVINKSAVGAVRGDEEGVNFPWFPPLTREIDADAEGIDEAPSLVILQESLEKDVQTKNKGSVTPIATKFREAAKAKGVDDEINFFFASAEGRLATKVREVSAKTSEKGLTVVLLDIPEGGYYDYTGNDVTEAGISAFLDEFKAGKLTKKEMQG